MTRVHVAMLMGCRLTAAGEVLGWGRCGVPGDDAEGPQGPDGARLHLLLDRREVRVEATLEAQHQLRTRGLGSLQSAPAIEGGSVGDEWGCHANFNLTTRRGVGAHPP